MDCFWKQNTTSGKRGNETKTKLSLDHIIDVLWCRIVRRKKHSEKCFTSATDTLDLKASRNMILGPIDVNWKQSFFDDYIQHDEHWRSTRESFRLQRISLLDSRLIAYKIVTFVCSEKTNKSSTVTCRAWLQAFLRNERSLFTLFERFLIE